MAEELERGGLRGAGLETASSRNATGVWNLCDGGLVVAKSMARSKDSGEILEIRDVESLAKVLTVTLKRTKCENPKA